LIIWSSCQCPQDKGSAAQLKFARRWISSHVAAAAGLGKPLVLGCSAERADFYQKVRPRAPPGFPKPPHP